MAHLSDPVLRRALRESLIEFDKAHGAIHGPFLLHIHPSHLTHLRSDGGLTETGGRLPIMPSGRAAASIR